MARTSQQSASVVDQGLLPFRRQVRSKAEVPISFGDVERAARVCLTQLVTDSLTSGAGKPEAVVSAFGATRALRVVVDSAVSPGSSRRGALGHLHWHAHRLPRLFPAMEAELLARPLASGGTELVLDATYQPPGGLLGVIGDVLIGRVVARSAARTFTGRLAHTVTDTLVDGRCGVWGPSRSGGDLA